MNKMLEKRTEIRNKWKNIPNYTKTPLIFACKNSNKIKNAKNDKNTLKYEHR